MAADLLLDTHTILWIAGGELLSPQSRRDMEKAIDGGGRLLFSAVSVWELGFLTTKLYLSKGRSLNQWIAELFAAIPVLEPVPLEFATAASAAGLPEPFHKDPADRLLVATARARDVPIVTRDARILGYAAVGHVKAIAC